MKYKLAVSTCFKSAGGALMYLILPSHSLRQWVCDKNKSMKLSCWSEAKHLREEWGKRIPHPEILRRPDKE